MRICFVCLGNIVRSPLAENLFRYHATKRGLDHKYEVDSAGTSDWHVGESPDHRMVTTAARRGIRIDGSSRQFRYADFDKFDLIIPMDKNNRASLNALAKSSNEKNKIHLLREFDPKSDSQASVPDPYYGGINGFEEVYDIVERSVLGLLNSLEDRLNR
ncbi:MAG: low molecular weight phosphotyrosine protein phosphatase [Anaerolineales bacterium]|nr:low molecular weight phosphotyrosine protein phosphatase [Anaerolineales bacterium]